MSASEPSYNLTTVPGAQSELDNLPGEAAHRIRLKLDEMAHQREPSSVKGVRSLNDHEAFLRIKVSNYRAIVANPKKSVLLVLLAVGPRDNFYKSKLDLATQRFEKNGGES